MKAMSLLVLALSLSFTIVSGADSDCHQVRTIVEWACRDACGTELMYQLCMDALRDEYRAQSINEVGEYAELAASQANAAYSRTRDFASYLGRNASLSGEERESYDFCDKSYGAAQDVMDKIYESLPDNCSNLANLYKAAFHGVDYSFGRDCGFG